MKTCFKCKKKLSINEFYKHAQMRDGHLNKCRSCTKSDAMAHRIQNIDRIREYDRIRGNRQSDQYVKRYREKYPNKYKAHIILNNAIRDKRIFKEPCCVCGEVNNIHGHHDDYLKPLNIRWMCSPCHSQWHRDNGQAKNP